MVTQALWFIGFGVVAGIAFSYKIERERVFTTEILVKLPLKELAEVKI
jgi:hypothetical protein